jgi:hypothetical protein
MIMAKRVRFLKNYYIKIFYNNINTSAAMCAVPHNLINTVHIIFYAPLFCCVSFINFDANASGLISAHFIFDHSLPPRMLGSLDEHPMPKSIPFEEIRLMPCVEFPLEFPLEFGGDFCNTKSVKSFAKAWNDSFLFNTGFSNR